MSAVRYRKSVEPVYTDGRDIDTNVAVLSGEGAQQESSGSPDKHIKEEAQAWTQLPQPNPHDPTYYDRPLLNQSVWSWAIPAYYYSGGLAGGSLVLAAALQLRRSWKLQRLIRRCRWIGFIGCCMSGALLVYDLGRPMRFLNMLRVFRPTSPMNLGAWVLSGTSGAAFGALLLADREGVIGIIGESAGYGAGVLGTALATYTGVLVSNTVVPLWQASRRVLPLLFAASALTSVGSMLEFFEETEEEARVSTMFGSVGEAAELTASIFTERHASSVPRVGRPFKRGLTSFLWRSSAVITASSLVMGLLPKKTRAQQVASAVLGTLGSLALRFAVERAGNDSTRDPRASFQRQRAETFAARAASS